MDPAEHGANTASVKEFDSNVMNVFPEIDAPYTRPPRKNTNFPKFPPGFSPWSDERDPGADPGAYPPATRHHFEELLKDVGSGIHPLVQHYVAPIWNQITNILIHTKFVTGLLGVLIAPIWVYVKVIDNWRHYNGWLYYLFYYIAATQGYLLRTNECWRVLREGPNKRFTITKQFWHRRGCEGGSDGFAIRDQLMHTVSHRILSFLLNTFVSLPRGIGHTIILILFWTLLGGFFWDTVHFVWKYAVWLWKRRVWPLVKDTFDVQFINTFFILPWLQKADQLWSAIWGISLGFTVHAFRPQGGAGVPIQQVNQLFQEPGAQANDPFAALQVVGFENQGIAAQQAFDPNNVVFNPEAWEQQEAQLQSVQGAGLSPQVLMDEDE